MGSALLERNGYLGDYYIQAQQRETLAITFNEPDLRRGLSALKALPGVRDVQWQPVCRCAYAHVTRTRSGPDRTSRTRLDASLLDAEGHERALAPARVLFTECSPRPRSDAGESVRVEPLIGDRTPRRSCSPHRIRADGALVHMTRDDFERWLAVRLVTGAVMSVDEDRIDDVQAS